MIRILVLHPRQWVKVGVDNVLVKHVSIGGELPKRLDGEVTYDGIGEKVTKEGIDDLFKVARNFKPDIFLFGIHFGFSRHMLSALKDVAKCKAVMHYTDQRVGVPNEVMQYKDSLDLVLLSNQDKDDHAKYNEIGLKTRVFYDGVSLNEYYPKNIVPWYDCVFGGNNFYALVKRCRDNKKPIPEGINFEGGLFRHNFIKAIDKRFKLQVYGKWGWDEMNLKRAPRPMVYHPRYIDVLRQGRLILNTYNIRLRKLYTRRLFRALATGRPYVTQYVDGMEEDFEDGKNIIWFKNRDEGIRKIRYYLIHNTEREQIGNNAVKLIMDKHTFKHRLAEFVKICHEEF